MRSVYFISPHAPRVTAYHIVCINARYKYSAAVLDVVTDTRQNTYCNLHRRDAGVAGGGATPRGPRGRSLLVPAGREARWVGIPTSVSAFTFSRSHD